MNMQKKKNPKNQNKKTIKVHQWEFIRNHSIKKMATS